MNKQSGNKSTIINTVDPTKPVMDELNEQDLNKVSGGTDKAPTPKAPTTTPSPIEIKDFSFDI
jgi:bacteriocin-like protein